MAEQAVQHEAQNMLVVKPLFYYFLRCIFHVTVVEVSILPQIPPCTIGSMSRSVR